ncbi:MAG: tetratricopeptide repeat protein [Crocinitomicaceae bacterium]|nr:tetratricopeptide repeat protein [Crocinitomicaceae bacterium]
MEPVLRYSVGHLGKGPLALNGIENIVFDKDTYKIYFLCDKKREQRIFQFLVKPPVPENTLTFDVNNGNLLVYFNKIKSRSVIGYGLLTTSSDNQDSIAVKTTSMVCQLNELADNLSLYHYGLVSISQSDYSDPTPGFDNYFGYGKRLLAAKRYEDAVAAFQNALDLMGRPAKMIEYISSELCKEGILLAQQSEINRALRLLKYAFTLTPKDIPTQQAYRSVLISYFRQLANREDTEALMDETKRMIVSEGLRPIVFAALDSVALEMGKIPNEHSINNAIYIEKKLIEWDPDGIGFFSSLAQLYYELYVFKSNVGAPGSELDVALTEAEKYGIRALKKLKETGNPYHHVQTIYLETLNAEGKFAETERLALNELSASSLSLSIAQAVIYRKQLATAFEGQAEYDYAVGEYDRILSLDPDNNEVLERKAKALFTNAKFNDAKEIYQLLLVQDRNNARFIAGIGNAELLMGNYAEASFQLEKAIRQDPSDRSFYGSLAEAFDNASNYKKAIECYEVAIQYQSDMLDIARKRMKSEKELRKTGDLLNYYRMKFASLNELTGNSAEAIVAYSSVIESDPKNAPAYYGLGKASLNAGLVYDAAKAFNEAANLEPSREEYSNAFSNAISLRSQVAANQAPLNIVDIHLKELFPSLYRNYADISLLPVGEVVIANNTSLPITPSSIKVFVKGLMDEPTFIKSPVLVSYSNTYVKLTALFNPEILATETDQSYQMEVEIEYVKDKKTLRSVKATTFVLHGRNAISWSDKRHLASFVSPNVKEFIEFNYMADQFFRDSPQHGLNKKILKALQVYTLLNHDRFFYIPDPVQSFATVTTNTDILDDIQYPAETMKKKSGDCDDLVAMFCGLLESAGIATSYIDVPGHVFMAFDSEIKPHEIANYGLAPTEVIIQQGSVWLPIETTLVGTQNFMMAWKSAAERYYHELTSGNFPELVALADARTVYLPSNYVPEGFIAEPVRELKVLDEYNSLVGELLMKTNHTAITEMENRYQLEPGNIYVKNKYASVLAQTGESKKAEEILLEALDLSPGNAAALNNLGNIYFMKKDNKKASDYYQKAYDADPIDAEILINLCKTRLLDGEKAQAKFYFDKAVSLDAEIGYIYDFLKDKMK